jgi:hypothetical protein
MNTTMQTTTDLSLDMTELALHEAQMDEFEMSATDDLIDKLTTISRQFIFFDEDKENQSISFTASDATFSPYMGTQAHYAPLEEVGPRKSLVIYKLAHSNEAGYGMLHEGETRLRCQKLDIKGVVNEAKKHRNPRAFMRTLLLDIDNLVARTYTPPSEDNQ